MTKAPLMQIGDEVRPMTPDEVAQWQADNAAILAAKQEAEADAALVESARQKIAQVSGLTAEEMRALGFAV